MKKQLVIFGLLILTFGISCKRENLLPPNVTISGRFVDSCTGQKIDGSIVVWKFVNSPSKSDKYITSVKADNSGNYKLKFHALRNEEYFVRAEPSSSGTYTAYSHIEPLNHVKRGDKLTYNAVLREAGSLDIWYKDVNPYNAATDSLYCVVTDAGTNMPHPKIIAHGDWNYGANIYLHDCFPLKVYLNWDVTKNNITTYHRDSIVCTMANETVYNLNY